MKNYKLIGLTGQSGAGKSTVAQTFLDLGAEVISADEIVSKLYSENSPCVKTISSCFGSDVLKNDGTPDRKKLAELAFSSAENTALLGKIVHPFVTDAVIAVVANEDIRKKRVMQRDCLTEAQAESRLKAQLSEDFFRVTADYVIENNGDRNELRDMAKYLFDRVKQR